MTEYKLISLCIVMYKLIAKVLANRLNKVQPCVISKDHSAFILRIRYMTLKLDMSKVYDKVKQNFLKALMRKIGFVDRWINLIMACVRMLTYSICINGQPMGGQPMGGIAPSI